MIGGEDGRDCGTAGREGIGEAKTLLLFPGLQSTLYQCAYCDCPVSFIPTLALVVTPMSTRAKKER